MCSFCGCGHAAINTNENIDYHDHKLTDDHHHHHSHAAGIAQAHLIQIEKNIFSKNNLYASANRKFLTEHQIHTINLLSSPGSGKTSLLINTIEQLKLQQKIAVIEGDQQTSYDADRIRNTGVPVIQINTGKGCHLDAHMVGHAIEQLNLSDNSLLMIENVGNLICPTAFDLGENYKVVILSVTEGEDKPLKYPDAFYTAQLMILNKIDLLPYISFDVNRCLDYARRINPELEIIQLSALTGAGMATWLSWLINNLSKSTIRLNNDN